MTSHDSTGDRECGMDAAAYVLGALEGDELEAFRAHLSTCAVCRDEVSAFQEVADTLPALAPPQPVPRGLKRRVMAEVRAHPHPAAEGKANGKRSPFRLPGWFASLPRPALAATAAAVFAIVIVAAVVAISSGGGTSSHVYSASVVGPGSAKLRVTGNRGELVVHGMPAPPGNDIYQVWLKRGQHPPSPTSALFSVTADGSGSVDVPGNLDGVSQVLVTPEPPGGSPAPTHAPVVVASLS
jgi:anti-sigma-K factor RskA